MLTFRQQQAASLLGWNEEEWNMDGVVEFKDDKEDWGSELADQFDNGSIDNSDSLDEDNPSDVDPEDIHGSDVLDRSWSQLTTQQQNAASILGYDREMWDGGIEPAAREMSWDEMTNEQDWAAKLLGWSNTTWDEGKAAAEDPVDEAIAQDQLDTVPGDSASIGNELNEESKAWDYSWDELTEKQKNAALLLEFDQEMWEAGLKTPACELSWDQMTPEQDDAATLLGWNKATWDGDKDKVVEDQADDVAAVQDPLDGVPDSAPLEDEANEDKAWDYSWAELTEEQRNAALILEFDQEMWEAGLKTPACELSWDEMTEAQEDAAALLGWNKATWDGNKDNVVEDQVNDVAAVEDPLDGVPDSAPLEDEANDDKAWDYSWAELTEEQRDAATLLGWSKATWDGDREKVVEDQVDDVAAVQDPLDGVPDSAPLEDEVNEDKAWDYSWAELTEEQRNAALILEFDQEMWEAGLKTPACELSWDEMTEAQEDAAALLGWNKATWDGNKDNVDE